MTNTDSGRQVLLTVAMGKRLLGDARPIPQSSKPQSTTASL